GRGHDRRRGNRDPAGRPGADLPQVLPRRRCRVARRRGRDRARALHRARPCHGDGRADLGRVARRGRVAVLRRASRSVRRLRRVSNDANGYRGDVSGGGAGGERVLVIDDEAPIRLLCRVNLEAEGMHVTEAADGATGLDLARNDPPDVVLLDVMMPGLDGWRVAEELLEDGRTNRIPIIFLTARAEFRDRARGLDIGGVDYVTKPFNPLELASLVRDLLSRIDRGELDELRGEKLEELRSLMETE